MNWKIKPPYRENPKWYADRNKSLKKDKAEGMGIAEICAKYDITQARMYYIVKREQNG